MAEVEIGQNLLQVLLAVVSILGGYVVGHQHCKKKMTAKGAQTE